MIFELIASFFGTVMPPVLILAGIYFGAETRFFYIFHPIKTARLMFSGRRDGISPMRAASMALAGTLGVGNITGVTAAIFSGGAGAVFWMWSSSVIAMSVKYAETALAVHYRRHRNGEYYGGAPFYISDGIGGKAGRCVGSIFAVLCVMNSLVIGNILQVNAAAVSMNSYLGVPNTVTGVIIAAVCFLIVIGGAGRISSLTYRLIPIASAGYIILCLIVIFCNFELLPNVIKSIFSEAFSFRSAASGAFGYGVSEAVRYGVTRGVLTNEAGSGTSPTAHAAADTASPTAQGCLGIFEVFADTIVICSATAFAVLIGKEHGIMLTYDAMGSAVRVFSTLIGEWSVGILTFMIFIFVFSTIISQHYYGECAMRYLGCKNSTKILYMLAFFGFTVIGATTAPKYIWTLSDITVGVMTTLNTACLFYLRRDVKKCTDLNFLSRYATRSSRITSSVARR